MRWQSDALSLRVRALILNARAEKTCKVTNQAYARVSAYARVCPRAGFVPARFVYQTRAGETGVV